MTLTVENSKEWTDTLTVETDGEVEELRYQVLSFHQINEIYAAEGLELPIPPKIEGRENFTDPEYQRKLRWAYAKRHMAIAAEMLVRGGSFVAELKDLSHEERANNLLALPMPLFNALEKIVTDMTKQTVEDGNRLVRRFRGL